MSHDIYSSPLASRYASGYMLHLFSDDSRYQTWRRLWTALARAQHQLGLPITDEQVAQLEAHITDIDYDVAARRQRAARHGARASSIWAPPAAMSPTTPISSCIGTALSTCGRSCWRCWRIWRPSRKNTPPRPRWAIPTTNRRSP